MRRNLSLAVASLGVAGSLVWFEWGGGRWASHRNGGPIALAFGSFAVAGLLAWRRPSPRTPALGDAPMTAATTAAMTAPLPVLEPGLPLVDDPGDDPTDAEGLPAAAALFAPVSRATRPHLTAALPLALFETANGAAGAREQPPLPPVPEDAATQEYRALFGEFVKLRRTCREPIDNLDPDRFVRALRRQRTELIQKHASKDVRFHLAFDNGKAAIRFTTIG